MKIERTDTEKDFEEFSITLTISQAKEAKLLYGFLCLDKIGLDEDAEDCFPEATRDWNVKGCIRLLLEAAKADSVFEGDEDVPF